MVSDGSINMPIESIPQSFTKELLYPQVLTEKIASNAEIIQFRNLKDIWFFMFGNYP